MSTLCPNDFKGTERFSIQRRLGEGGFGVVYQAFDRERNSLVALKTLKRDNIDGLYRFKQEFRLLADIHHSNLVSLYELMTEGEEWFFTMELVDGVDFLRYITNSTDSSDAINTPTRQYEADLSINNSDLLTPVVVSKPTATVAKVDMERLRETLRQITRGVNALHNAGRLHRDLKPSNVLITAQGRALILDFGLVTDLAPQANQQSQEIIGTPEYMSPERGTGKPETEASDWYSVGVMLYEALTGQLPFFGSYIEIMVEKLQTDPPPPRDLAADIPEDLALLCEDLLSREPEKRPKANEILQRLGEKPNNSTKLLSTSLPSIRTMPFVGRVRQLSELQNAFTRLKEGRPVAVFVQGISGIGKSSLIRHFLDSLRPSDALVLMGRCYERESVPYKALDDLIDNLSSYLKNLSNKEIEALLPRDVLALVRLFPVLRQVDAVMKKLRNNVEIPDSQELRRRAFAALKELLGRISDDRPLVLFIDDLQWGDLDSASLLCELLRPPDPPTLMLLASCRSEEAATSSMLNALAPLRDDNELLDFRELSLTELTFAEACKLAVSMLDDNTPNAAALAETIARESNCNPFFIAELAIYLQDGEPLPEMTIDQSSSNSDAVRARLEEVIRTRVAELSPAARHIVELVAVAGQPLDLKVMKQAVGNAREDQAALVNLRVAHMIKIRNLEHRSEIECYHDRIRETIAASLSIEKLKECHLQIALALEATQQPDLEALAVHFKEAGDLNKAAKYTTLAADFAAQSLAFDRAARLYQMALTMARKTDGNNTALLIKYGDALVNIGHGRDAARAYQDAAERINGESIAQAFQLRCRAAEQLLISGHIDDGLDALKSVLTHIGMKIAATPSHALFSILWRRGYLNLRGLNFKERAHQQVSADELIRIDACWAAATGLGFVDPIRGADFQARHLLLALKTGEPYRVSRALACEASYSGLGGGKSSTRSQQILTALKDVSERVTEPREHAHAHALALLEIGLVTYGEGRWVKAQEYLERAEQVYRDSCTGFTFEMGVAKIYSLRSLLFRGGWGEIWARYYNIYKDAQERGDLLTATQLVIRIGYAVMLAADQPEMAMSASQEAMKLWSNRGFLGQHLFALIGSVETALYQGLGEKALAILQEKWPDISRSMLLRVQVLRIEVYGLRARCAITNAIDLKDSIKRVELLQIAESDAQRVEREKMTWGDPLALLIQASIAQLRNNRSQAIELLINAENKFDKAGMLLHKAIASLRRGQLIGGNEGNLLINGATEAMVAQHIKRPDRIADMLAPGIWN